MTNRMLIVDSIKTYLSDDNIKLFKEEDKTVVIFNNKKSVVSVTDSSNWNDVKKYIDLCKTSESEDKQITCDKCINDINIHKYIEIIRNNNGLFICPICTFTFGRKMNKYELDNLEYMMYLKDYCLSTVANV